MRDRDDLSDLDDVNPRWLRDNIARLQRELHYHIRVWYSPFYYEDFGLGTLSRAVHRCLPSIAALDEERPPPPDEAPSFFGETPPQIPSDAYPWAQELGPDGEVIAEYPWVDIDEADEGAEDDEEEEFPWLDRLGTGLIGNTGRIPELEEE